MVGTVDVLLGNLEDADQGRQQGSRPRRARPDRQGTTDFGAHPAVDPDQRARLPVGARRPHHAGHRDRRQARRDHGPQGAGRRGHPLRRPAARPARGQGRPDRPILVHAILETARGVANVEEICGASPRMQGLSLGPADLAADRRMKTTRVGGGHPGYLVRQDPTADDSHRGAPRRSSSRTCGTTRSRGWSTPARCTASTPTTGRSATSPTWSRARTSSATRSCSAASAPGACTPSRSRSPTGSSRPVGRRRSSTPAGSSRRWATAPARSCSTARWRTTPPSSSAW